MDIEEGLRACQQGWDRYKAVKLRGGSDDEASAAVGNFEIICGTNWPQIRDAYKRVVLEAMRRGMKHPKDMTEDEILSLWGSLQTRH